MASFLRAWRLVINSPNTLEAIFVKSLHQQSLSLIFMPFGTVTNGPKIRLLARAFQPEGL
jgi:hypothetical protein